MAASFSQLPFEIHRMIFDALVKPTQSRRNFLRNGVPDIFGNGHKRKSDGVAFLCVLHPAWRVIIQMVVFAELNLPAVLTTAEEDIEELIGMIYLNSALAKYINVLSIIGPYGDQATAALWKQVFALLKHISPQQIKFQPYINAVTGPLERLVMTGKEEEERFLLNDYKLNVEPCMCRELILHCSLEGSMEISQPFIRQIIQGLQPNILRLETTDWRRSRLFRRKLYDEICVTVSSLHAHLTSFSLVYPSRRPVDERRRAFPLCESDKLCNALRVICKRLVVFQYLHGRVSPELLQDDEEWPYLETYRVSHDPIDAFGDWWSHHKEGDSELEDNTDPNGFDEMPTWLASKRTNPKMGKHNKMTEVVLSAVLRMPKLKNMYFTDRRKFINKFWVEIREGNVFGRFVSPCKSVALAELREQGRNIEFENWLE